MTLHLSERHARRLSAPLAAAVFAAAAMVALPAGAGDGPALTETGQVVGAGYVAPGFVIDGPPPRRPDDAPAAAAAPPVQLAQSGGAELTGAAPAGTPAEPASPQLAALLAQADDGVNDPLEPLNRVIFDVNHFLERLILRPVAELYVLMIPDEGRTAIRSFLRNIRTPVILANDLLQGEGDRAWNTTRRFFINSTVGLGGLIDVADRVGIPHHDEDLGQTFAVWGVGEMFYLVLPIMGPSNPRDAVGKFADRYLDPIWWWTENTDRDAVQWSRTVVGGVDSYSRVMDELRKIEETSVDYYAAIRSIYRQHREAEIRNRDPADAPLPDLQYDFNADLN